VYQAFQQYGYHIVSAAYRFIPQVSFDDIVDDCKDSLAWCIDNLPGFVGADSIDIDRYVVAGDSAGGTLSTISGHVLRPRPRAVINVFGVVDVFALQGKKNVQDSAPAAWSREYKDVEGEMEKAKMDRDPANAEITCPWYWEYPDQMNPDDLRSFWGLPDFHIQDKHYRRMDLLNYFSMKGELFDNLYRKDTFKTEDDYDAYLKSVSPHHLLDKYPDYPPTFILHGTGDSAVPVEQSYKFAQKLREHKIPMGEKYKEGGEHCFENKIEVSLPELYQRPEIHS
jgi:acetyl esterase/lipase